MLVEIPGFERPFLDGGGDDLKGPSDSLRGQPHNPARDPILEPGLPVTQGLQETLRAFRGMGVGLGLKPVLDALAGWPLLDLEVYQDAKAFPPGLAVASVVAYALVLEEPEPGLGNPWAGHR